MTYRRARVAITIQSDPSPHDPYQAVNLRLWQYPRSRIHVGHVRTLLLGALHCEREGIPFHIRLDGSWERPEYHYGGVIDLAGCMAWFGIRAAKVYRAPIGVRPRPDTQYAQQVGPTVWARIRETIDHLASLGVEFRNLIMDDLVDYYPSLMIRGMEFAEGADYAPEWPPEADSSVGIQKMIALEKAVFEAAGREHLQLSLPMITDDYGAGMSKSVGGVPWDAMQAASVEDARTYLLATAANPLDPLSAIGQPVDVQNLDPQPHVWSWETWGSYLRQA
jgi:hypothetical protein